MILKMVGTVLGHRERKHLRIKLGAIRERELCEVKQYLEKHITKECEGNLDTGIFGTPLLFETLVEFGLGEVAYHMITSVTYPSYGYMITNGATTLWEYWEKEYGFLSVSCES